MSTSSRSLASALVVLSAVPGALAGVSAWNGSGTDDRVDWGTLGPDGTVVGNPFSITSLDGRGLSVSMPVGDFERADEGSGWIGNFSLGDKLLWTALNEGPITFRFDDPILGFGGGAQIQPDFYGPFDVEISAYDSANSLLGTVSLSGASTPDEDGSAILAGIISDSANIETIEMRVLGAGPGLPGFALNTLLLKVGAVPEGELGGWKAASIAVGFAVAVWARRRARARRPALNIW